MKRIQQTRYGYPGGNCFAACVASILELSLDEVPDISSAADDWWDGWQAWLRERGLTLFGWPVKGNLDPPGYAILGTRPPHLVGTGPTPEAEVGHAVVAYEGEPVHNPNPTFTDLGPWEWWYAFGVIDASKAR